MTIKKNTPLNFISFYIKGFDNKKHKYVSIPYRMTRMNEQERELKKTYYIIDKKERLQEVRRLLKANDLAENKLIPQSTIDNYKISIINNNNFDSEYNNPTMIYGTWTETSNVRILEIINYVYGLFSEADNLNKTDTNKAINHLINKQFEYHKGVFEHPIKDLKYSNEYNEFIFDLLQYKIKEISNIEIEPIDETLKKAIRKPLKWNADKNTIGTLFGLLHNAKIVTGTKEDLIRGLTSLFDNLKASTLKDNINLKVNTTDNKILYDVETETMLKNWIKTLKQQNTKSTTN